MAKVSGFDVLVLLCLLVAVGPAYAAPQATKGQQASGSVQGTWSGTFFSNYLNVPSFTITIVITPNGQGHLTGDSTLNSHCLKGAKLDVTVTNSQVVLAGSDNQGDNLTLRGTLDSTGTMLPSIYIMNGSASGACETDDGTGTLTAQ